jgi:PD-(D/E)XK nuclease superfamily
MIGLSEIKLDVELRQMIHHKGPRGPPSIAPGMPTDASERLSYDIVGAALEVHRRVGPGLLESAYDACLCRELTLRGIPHARQVPLSLNYHGISLDCGYRLDLVVGERVVVEVKSVAI